MSRATRFLAVALPLTITYLLALLRLIPVPFLSERTSSLLLPVVRPFLHPSNTTDPAQIPWWFLVSFGAYSLGSLGMGLLRFRDCPEAYEELLVVSLPSRFMVCGADGRVQEISQAKNQLRDQGVSVD